MRPGGITTLKHSCGMGAPAAQSTGPPPSHLGGLPSASVQAPGSSGPTTALAASEHTLRSAWLRVTCAVSPGRTTVTRSALAVEKSEAKRA